MLAFDDWFSKVRRELCEETGGILADGPSVRDAYARGDTPEQFVRVSLWEMSEATWNGENSPGQDDSEEYEDDEEDE